jgi:lipopolysaccharide transport system permease protein
VAGRGVRSRVAAAWGRARTLGELGWLLFLRDYRSRFRQTYFGSLWAIGQVVAAYLPLVLVGSQLGLGSGQDPRMYALNSLLGLMLFQMFWDGLYMPQWLGRRLRSVVTEVPLPDEALLVAGACYALFNATIYVLLMFAAYVGFGIMPPASIVLGILSVPLVIGAGVAVGVFFVPMTLIYLDFRYGLPMLQPALMWTAPILYTSPPSGPLHLVNQLNPLTYLLDAPRDWLTSGWALEEAGFPVAILFSLALLTLGLRFYRHSMPRALECLPRK